MLTWDEVCGCEAVPETPEGEEIRRRLLDDSQPAVFSDDVLTDARYIVFMAQYGTPRDERQGA